MVQMVDQPPIKWVAALTTASIYLSGDQVGSQTWTDYEVSVDVRMEEAGSVTLWAILTAWFRVSRKRSLVGDIQCS